MSPPGLTATLLFVALAGSVSAAAQTTVAENNDTNHMIGPYYYGQSFTPTASGDHVSITFRDGGGQDAASGRLYLFTASFVGAPADLASATGASSYLGQASAAANAYSFDPALSLNAGQQYFAYADTAQTLAYSDANPYSGGGAYGSGSSGSSFGDYTAQHDFGFTVRSAAAVAQATPEPASWILMVGGFGIVGGMLRRGAKRRTAAA